jgi:hypothetical protein
LVPYFFFFSKNTSNSKSADPMEDIGTWRHCSIELGAEGEERQVMRAACMLISLFMGAARFPQRIPLTCGA